MAVSVPSLSLSVRSAPSKPFANTRSGANVSRSGELTLWQLPQIVLSVWYSEYSHSCGGGVLPSV